MQNLKGESTCLSNKIFFFINYQIHMGLNFIYIFVCFFTYIILFTQYAGLYIANFDELQTNMLQTN